MKTDAPVLLLHNLPAGSGESETDIFEEVLEVSKSLDLLGIAHDIVPLRSLADLPAALQRRRARLAFNLVEGFSSAPSDAMLVPSVCRAFGIETTGCDTRCLTLTLDKWATKGILTAAGLATPAAVLVHVGENVPFERLPAGLCIVKPVASDASEGIDSNSVLDSSDHGITQLVCDIHRRFGQAALIEQFIGKREINVSLIQIGDTIHVMPLAEIDFSAFGKDRPPIVGYTAKWIEGSFEYGNSPRIIPAPVTERQAVAIRETALSAWRAAGCIDYARIDFRLDDKGRPFVIEINPNPAIGAEDGFVAACRAGGITNEQFVRGMLENAEARATCVPHEVSGPEPVPAAAQGACAIRPTVAGDRGKVLGMVNQPMFFRADEIEIAREVLDDAIARPGKDGYCSYVAERGGTILGWVCFGPTACTVHTFDIYWIVVAAGAQRCGIGKQLMLFAENGIRERGGRLVVVETSSRPEYDATRAFYRKLGYVESPPIQDFYAPGDDKVIAVNRL